MTTLQALELRSELRIIEAELGRVRTEDKYAARTIDLDLCFFADLIIQSLDFSLPDPDIHHRAHLAVPLADLDPGFMHPIMGETLGAIADRLRHSSQLEVRKDIKQDLILLIREKKS